MARRQKKIGPVTFTFSSRPMTSRRRRAQYKGRYNARPETFNAYEDAWKTVRKVRRFKGGFTGFTRAANAEPSIRKARVRRAERLMGKAGYASAGKTPGVGRRWHQVAAKQTIRRRAVKSVTRRIVSRSKSARKRGSSEPQ